MTARAPSPLSAGMILARAHGLPSLEVGLAHADEGFHASDKLARVEQLFADYQQALRLSGQMETKSSGAVVALRQAVQILEAVHGQLARPVAAPSPAGAGDVAAALPARTEPAAATLHLARQILVYTDAVDVTELGAGVDGPERMAVDLALQLEAVIDERLTAALEQLRVSLAEKGQA